MNIPRIPLLRPLVILALTLAVTACTASSPQSRLDGGAVAPMEPASDLLATVDATFLLVHTRHIDSPNLRRLSLSALGALTALDAAVTVNVVGNDLVARHDTRTVLRAPLPPDNRPGPWADLTVRAARALQEPSQVLQTVGDNEIAKALVDGALATLDRYSSYAEPTEATSRRQDRHGFSGVGLRFTVVDEGAKVLEVFPGGPAEEGGLRAEDIIQRVDGKSIAGRRATTIRDLITGPEGSKVMLTLGRADTPAVRTVTLRRRHIVPPTATLERRNDVAVLRLSGFNESTGATVLQQLAELSHDSKVRALVLDMRGNSGGLLDQAVAVADAFLDRGTVVYTHGRHPRSRQTHRAAGSDVTRGLPVVVLVDGLSASAAEIVAAALQDHDRALVIGSTTFGKGTVQTVVDLPNQGELTLTWSRFHAPSGYSLNEMGVVPEVCTSTVRAEKPALAAARRLSPWRPSVRPGQPLTPPQTRRMEAQRKQCPPVEALRDLDLDLAVALAAQQTRP